MRDRRDRQKKRFIETLATQVRSHAAVAAGVSRWTAYRWRHEDLKFASLWYQALENAVDAVCNDRTNRAILKQYWTADAVPMQKNYFVETLHFFQKGLSSNRVLKVDFATSYAKARGRMEVWFAQETVERCDDSVRV